MRELLLAVAALACPIGMGAMMWMMMMRARPAEEATDTQELRRLKAEIDLLTSKQLNDCSEGSLR